MKLWAALATVKSYTYCSRVNSVGSSLTDEQVNTYSKYPIHTCTSQSRRPLIMSIKSADLDIFKSWLRTTRSEILQNASQQLYREALTNHRAQPGMNFSIHGVSLSHTSSSIISDNFVVDESSLKCSAKGEGFGLMLGLCRDILFLIKCNSS